MNTYHNLFAASVATGTAIVSCQAGNNIIDHAMPVFTGLFTWILTTALSYLFQYLKKKYGK